MKQRTAYRWFIVFICLVVVIPGWIAAPRITGSLVAAGSYPYPGPGDPITITEDFTSYTYRYENLWSDWNVWDGQLALDKMSAWARQGAASVMQPDGIIFAGWADQRGGENNLFLQKLDVSGNRLWQYDQRINDPVISPSRRALALVLDGQGGVYAIFKDGRVAGSDNPDIQHLYAQHIGANGQRLWTIDALVADGLNSDEPDFHAAPVPGGGFAVLWKRGHYWASDQNLYLQRFTSSGAPVFAQPVSVAGPGELTYTLVEALTVTPQGALFPVWISVDMNTSGANDLWGRWVEPSGQLRSPAPLLLVSHQSEYGVHNPETLALADGSAYLAWCSGQANGWQGFVQRIDANGVFLWSSPVALEPAPNRNICINMNGVLDAQENLVLWWNHWDLADPIRVQNVSPSGQVLVQTRQVDTNQPYPAGIVLEKLGAGNAVGNIAVFYLLNTYLAAHVYGPDSTTRSPAPNIINDLDSTARQVAPRAAANPDGSTYIAWQTWDMGSGSLFFQRFNASGQPLLATAPRLNMGQSAEDRLVASLAVDGQNNAAAAWEFGLSDRTEIHVQKISAAGAPMWPADKAVVAGSTVNQSKPSVGADAAGNVYVAWVQDDTQVLMQKFSSTGARLWNTGTPVNITPIPAGWQLAYRGFPALDVSPQGQVTVGWLQNVLEPIGPDSWKNHNRIYVQRFSANGQPVWPADKQANTPDDNFNGPYNLSLDVDPTGGVYALINYMGPYEDETHVARITATGTRPWASDLILSDPHHFTYYANLAAESDGTAVVAFLQPDVNPHIAARKISPDGTLLWDADKWVNDIQLRTPRYPSVAALPDGTSTIAYELNPAGGNDDVLFSRLNSAGSRILGTTSVLAADRFYQPAGEAQSLRLNPSGYTVESAVLNADFSANGGGVQFYLSNNGGATWESVAPGAPHTFVALGEDTRWRIVLQANPGLTAGPVIRSLTITLNPSGALILNPVYLPSIGK